MADNSVFRTERLIVRPWLTEDVEAHFAIYSDPEVMRHLKSAPRNSLEESSDWIKDLLKRNAERPEGLGGWAIERLSDRQVVGTCLLKTLPEDIRIEVGWHLGSAYWGQGYATEAGIGAMRHGFERVGLEEIFAIVSPENLASQRVCDRIGLEFREMTSRYHQMELRLYSAEANAWLVQWGARSSARAAE